MKLSNKRIKWLISDIDMSIASIRLRCLHFARALDEGFNIKSSFYNDILNLEKSLVSGDILIIVKYLDFRINRIVLKSYSVGIPVLIDVCDNIIDPFYKQNDFSFHLNNLLSLSKFLTKIIVPNHSLKEIFAKALENEENKPEIFTLPDPAESENDVFLTSKYLISQGETLSKNFSNFVREKISYEKITREGRKNKILWFGNSFSPTSNMGLVSLIPHLKNIKKMQKDTDFVLTICSDFRADISFLDKYEINFKLVDWTLNNIFYELSTASCSLITTGNDERCFTKSNNRLLKSLANGCPAIVINCFNDFELKGYFTNSLKEGILNFIKSKDRDKHIKNAIEESKIILERFEINNLAKTYSNLILDSHLLTTIYGRKYIDKSITDFKVSIICDQIPVRNLKEIVSRFKEKDNKYTLKFLFQEYNLELLNFFIEEKIIPYNCGAIKSNSSNAEKKKFITRMSKILKEDELIIISDRKSNNNIMQFLEDSKNNLRLKYKKYDDFLLEYKSIKKKTFLINEKDYLPTNIPGPNLPINIFNEKDLNLDILFITTYQTKNWILDGIAKEIGSRGQNIRWSIFYYSKETYKELPNSKSIFFMHQSILDLFIVRKLFNINLYKVMCWYTHPNPLHEKNNIISRYIDNFNKIDKVVFACNRYKKLWIQRGVKEEKTICITGGADEEIFTFHDRKKSKLIGLSSSYYERKNPMLLYKIVKNMMDYKFILLGKNWQKFSLFDDLLLNGNLEYVEAKYNDFPKYYQKIKVFLSLSDLEGGPIPLIEAMMSNCFPITSDVGLCPDVIEHGRNGFLFDPNNYNVEEIILLIKKAFNMDDINIRDTVIQYNWNSFSENVLSLL